jgi:TolB-like protein
MQQANSTERKTKSKERGISCSVLYVLCFLVFAFCTLLFASIFIHLGFAAERHIKERVALMTFENLSDDKNALSSVMPVIREKLEAKGFEVLDEDSLSRFLLKERIRCTGYITKDDARKLYKEFNVKAILIGSVNSFYSGENPRIGFSARLINASDGTIMWANHAAATGEDFTTVLGLGRISDIDMLIYRVADKLLYSFRTAQNEKEMESTYRIAVMPFQNKSRTREAGMIATYMFIVELFNNKKFMPIEYGEVRYQIVDLRVREKGELDLKKTEAISKASGVDGIIVGTVEAYNEGEGTAPPEASISARLIDAHRDRLLWSETYHARGDDDIRMFDWGRINLAEAVAYKTVIKLVKEMSRVKWR